MNNNVSDWNAISSKMVVNPAVLEDATDTYVTEVTFNEKPMEWLANAIADAIGIVRHDYTIPEDLANKFGTLPDLFIAVATVALGARIAQINHLRGFDKKNFMYPAVLNDILQKYGEVRNQEEAYTITPVWSDALKAKLEELGAVVTQKSSKTNTNWQQNTQFVVPDWYERAVSFLSHFGLFVGYGLPKDVVTAEEQIYQIRVDGDRIVGKAGISNEFVLTTAFVSATQLSDLFGAYRTLYGGIRMVRSAIETIGMRALHDVIGK